VLAADHGEAQGNGFVVGHASPGLMPFMIRTSSGHGFLRSRTCQLSLTYFPIAFERGHANITDL
jgi:hypothetical protein